MAAEHSTVNIKSEEKFFKIWFSDDKPEMLNILVTGKTSVGKSRLVNALVGNEVAKESRGKDPCTTQVTCYEVNIEDVKVTMWDSPGLQDGTNKKSEYIQDMKEKIKDIALMIYCVRMDNVRFYEADKKAIKILTHEFGPDIWKHAVVALTFANRVEDPDGGDESEYFKMQLQNWIKQFKDYFAAVGVNPEVCCIPVIPVGNAKKSMCLPDRDNWLSHAWIECYQVMKASARQGMYRINKNRLRFDDSTTAPNTKATQCNANKVSELEIPINDQQKESFWMSTWEATKSATSAIASFAGDALMTIIKNTQFHFDYQNSEGVHFRLNSQPRSPVWIFWQSNPGWFWPGWFWPGWFWPRWFWLGWFWPGWFWPGWFWPGWFWPGWFWLGWFWPGWFWPGRFWPGWFWPGWKRILVRHSFIIVYIQNKCRCAIDCYIDKKIK